VADDLDPATPEDVLARQRAWYGELPGRTFEDRMCPLHGAMLYSPSTGGWACPEPSCDLARPDGLIDYSCGSNYCDDPACQTEHRESL
jgi:hypothetical protein